MLAHKCVDGARIFRFPFPSQSHTGALVAEAISPPQGLEPCARESLCQLTAPGSAFVDSTNTDCIPATARSLFLVFGQQNMVHSPFFILVSPSLCSLEEAARPGGSLIRYEKGKWTSGGRARAPAPFSTWAKPRDAQASDPFPRIEVSVHILEL